MFGWYSKKASEQFGYCIYLNSSGEEVKVTNITKEDGSSYEWDDKINVGRVTKYIRSYWKMWAIV